MTWSWFSTREVQFLTQLLARIFCFYQISWINQMSCVSPCWGRERTPVVCNARRKPHTGYYPSRPVTTNKLLIAAAIPVNRYTNFKENFKRFSLWRWFPGCIRSLDSGGCVQEHTQPVRPTPVVYPFPKEPW